MQVVSVTSSRLRARVRVQTGYEVVLISVDARYVRDARVELDMCKTCNVAYIVVKRTVLGSVEEQTFALVLFHDPEGMHTATTVYARPGQLIDARGKCIHTMTSFLHAHVSSVRHNHRAVFGFEHAKTHPRQDNTFRQARDSFLGMTVCTADRDSVDLVKNAVTQLTGLFDDVPWLAQACVGVSRMFWDWWGSYTNDTDTVLCVFADAYPIAVRRNAPQSDPLWENDNVYLLWSEAIRLSPVLLPMTSACPKDSNQANALALFALCCLAHVISAGTCRVQFGPLDLGVLICDMISPAATSAGNVDDEGEHGNALIRCMLCCAQARRRMNELDKPVDVS